VSPLITHINFLHAIDEDLYNLNRYIDFDERNCRTFSVETVRVLLSACAEIDSIMRQIVQHIEPTKIAKNMDDYFDPIITAFPDILQAQVVSLRFKITLQPWENWAKGSATPWWAAHNRVKHRRHEHFEDGNLQNALFAVAALEVVIMCFRHFHQVSGKGDRQRVFMPSGIAYIPKQK
jgi:hypothetical protein